MAGHRGEPADSDTLVHQVAESLAAADPLRLISRGAPRDEYAPEVRTIVPRLAAATCEADVATIVHEEFVRWFGPVSAGAREHYADVASSIWRACAAVAPAEPGA